MIIPETEADVRNALRLRLGREPRADIWEELVEGRYVQEILGATSRADAGVALVELLERYQEQDRRYPVGRRRDRSAPVVRRATPDQRLHYITRILALDAAEEGYVVAFRRDRLGGRLLEPKEVEGWRREQERAGATDTLDLLAFATSQVSDMCHWDEQDARVFILSGRVPEIWLPTATARHTRWYPAVSEEDLFPLGGPSIMAEVREYPALDIVEMRVPMRLSPQDVARFYERVRREALREWGYESALSDRSMTTKHLELAVFARAHREGTLAERMAAWNETHPEWRYGIVTNFGRDLASAYERLVGRPLNEKRRRGEENGNG